MEYRYYNFKIFEAAAEIAGDTDAERFIFEIGRRTGYASTALDNMSEVTYKKKKRAVIENIAKRLHLADQ